MDSESQNDSLAEEKQLLASVANKDVGTKAKTYIRLCGPGWLQSAITLGGGSLVGALWLGVIGGTGFMWLQPLAMILGVIMLSAIAYVTLSTGERPFQAINQHVSPVLGWGWLIATMMANMVWACRSSTWHSAAVTSNLAPGMSTGAGFEDRHLRRRPRHRNPRHLVVWHRQQGGEASSRTSSRRWSASSSSRSSAWSSP